MGARFVCLWMGGVLAGAGCVTDLGETPLFGQVVQQCELPTPAEVQSQPSPLPLSFADGTLWVFGETWLPGADREGRRQRDNTVARVASVQAACDGELDYVIDDDGVPVQVIALSAEEQALNALGADRIVLWPVGGFVFEERAFIYYDKVVLNGGDYFDVTHVGTGLCVMSRDGMCERALPGVFDDEPSLLWRWPTPSWGQGAVLADDGKVYLYSCDKHGDFDHRCRTARVAAATATDATAYEYLRFGGEWGRRVEDASAELRNQTAMSVAWNDFVGGYITLSARLLDTEIELRSASEPSGPWGDPLALFEAREPSSWFVGGVQQHPGLSTKDRDLVISYRSNTEDGSGVHLSTYRMNTPVRGAGR